MKCKLVCWALVMPLLIVVEASAQDEERPRRDGEMRARMIEEFDADGDGELNDDERQTARESMRERRGDRPGRGQGEGRPGGRGPRPEGGRGAEGRGPQGRGFDFARMFDRFDADGDGLLSRDEFTKLSERLRERFSGDGPRRGGRGEGFGGPGRGGPRGDRGPRADRPQRPAPERSLDVEVAPVDDGSTPVDASDQ